MPVRYRRTHVCAHTWTNVYKREWKRGSGSVRAGAGASSCFPQRNFAQTNGYWYLSLALYWFLFLSSGRSMAPSPGKPEKRRKVAGGPRKLTFRPRSISYLCFFPSFSARSVSWWFSLSMSLANALLRHAHRFNGRLRPFSSETPLSFSLYIKVDHNVDKFKNNSFIKIRTGPCLWKTKIKFLFFTISMMENRH